MSKYEIIRSWKDEYYLEGLSAEQRSQLRENPAGMLELSDADMEIVAGGDDNFSRRVDGDGNFSFVAYGCLLSFVPNGCMFK